MVTYIKKKRCVSYRQDLEVDMQALLLHLEHEMTRLRELASRAPAGAYQDGVHRIIHHNLVAAETQHRLSLAIFSRLPHCTLRLGASEEPGDTYVDDPAVDSCGEECSADGSEEGDDSPGSPHLDAFMVEQPDADAERLGDSTAQNIVDWHVDGPEDECARWQGMWMSYRHPADATSRPCLVERVHFDSSGSPYVSAPPCLRVCSDKLADSSPFYWETVPRSRPRASTCRSLHRVAVAAYSSQS